MTARQDEPTVSEPRTEIPEAPGMGACSAATIAGQVPGRGDPPANGPEDVGYSGARVRAALRFRIPPRTPERECRSCFAPIYWIVTPSGRRMPVDPDGTSHFASCPDAEKHRRRGSS